MLSQQPLGKIKTYFVLALSVVCIYFLALPSLLCFKNDGIFSHYPVKHFMGESFANGQVPLWNAFINWGYPQYADLTGAWWNPLTWLFGAITHYPVWAFHLEQILYVLIAALGMRRLLLALSLWEPVAIIGAICYISMGYLGEHYLFKEWVCGAAFLPWCLLYQVKSLSQPSIGNNTKWAASLFLFVASAHPSQSIALLYLSLLILLLAAYECWIGKNWNRLVVQQQSGYLTITAISFLVLVFGLAMSFAEVIPFMKRGETLAGKITKLPVGTTLQSWITLLAPLTGIKNNEWFGNWQSDSYMARNCFIGTICIAALLPMKGYTFRRIERQLWLLFGLFFCLASVAPFRLFCFQHIPLFGFTQMNGVYRIFPMLLLIILACYRLQFAFSSKHNYRYLLKNSKLLMGVFSVMLLAGLLAVSYYKCPGITRLLASGMSAGVLKNVLYLFSNSEWWLMQGFVGLIFTAAIFYSLKKVSYQWLIAVVIAEGAFYTNIFLPFSSLQSGTQQQVQQVIKMHERREWLMPLQNRSDSNSTLLKTEFRHPNIFLHQTYQDSTEETPMLFTSVKALVPNHQTWLAQPYSALYYPAKEVCIQNSSLLSNDFLHNVCCNTQSSNYIQNWNAVPGSISFTLQAPEAGYCMVMQSFYLGWSVTINEKKMDPVAMNTHFLAVAVNKGENRIQFIFNAGWKPYWIIVTFVLLSIIAGTGSVQKIRHYLRMRSTIKEPGNQLFRNSHL